MATLNLTEVQRGRLLLGLLFAALILVAVSTFSFFAADASSKQRSMWAEQIRGLGEDALTLATQAESVARSVNPFFFELLVSRDNLTLALDDLEAGAPRIGMRPLPSQLSPELNAARATVDALVETIDTILGYEQSHSTLVQERGSLLTALEAGAEQAGQVIDNARGRRAELVASAGAQWALIERVRSNLGSAILSGVDAAAVGNAIANDWAALQALQPTLSDAFPAPQDEISAMLAGLSPSIEAIQAASEDVSSLQRLAATSRGEARLVLADARALEQALEDRVASLDWVPTAALVGLVIATLAIALFLLLFYRGLRQRADRAAEREAKQQQAILGLLDEITNLADGDLTMNVTVSEDFTGAIADSLNYTVQNMRELVGTINQTSARVASGADATQQLAQRMSAGSERQASDIAALTQQMAATATTLTAVAERAESVAEQAQESVDVARGGAETALGTINVMTALREQIQDTSKRIKRLGESSQEIGNIIELINDIAEQTGTLALNAAIQAAMAGEQGRGFAVVAEEVQRLAERASTATRQVETLVKTIQADTNEAIVSMERSTHNVVSGARSAEEAGGALSRVQTSSQTMAELIASIAGEARGQSATTTDAAKRMLGIREISTQTSRSSAETAQAVAELSALSTQLRQSVTGFKLPDAG